MTQIKYAVRWKSTNISILLDKTKYNKKTKKKKNFGQKTRQPKPTVKQMGFERSSCMTIAMYLVLIQKPRWTMPITH